jgi:two-component system, OmpR family, response regulator VicR
METALPRDRAGAPRCSPVASSSQRAAAVLQTEITSGSSRVTERSKKRIWIVEDDRNLARVLSDNLTFEGYHVHWMPDGDAAVASIRSAPPDLILLDVMLPGRDGFDLCAQLRQGGRTPIIMLTARTQKVDKLRGLDLGADDYITKPFDLDELMARIRAVLRRRGRDSVDQVKLGRVIVDFRGLRAQRESRDLHLTHREFELLLYLAERPERVVHRDELLREVWGYLAEPTTRSVDLAVARLRKKIEEDPHRPRFIVTVHGDGYCLNADER